MNSKEVIKRLTEEGWLNVGGKGDHLKFKHPDKQAMSWFRICAKTWR